MLFTGDVTIYVLGSDLRSRVDAMDRKLDRLIQMGNVIMAENAEVIAVLAQIDEHTNGIAGGVEDVRLVVVALRDALEAAKDGMTAEEVAALASQLQGVDAKLSLSVDALKNVAADPANPVG